VSNTDVVRASFQAFHSQDRATAERLLADDFAFTSPQDDHLDKTTYMERCFPTAEHFVGHQLLHLIDVDRDGVFVLYEYELANGERYRNAEFIRLRDGQLVETQVFFGGRV
jgi:ketosteroid isomerase-like protein